MKEIKSRKHINMIDFWPYPMSLHVSKVSIGLPFRYIFFFDGMNFSRFSLEVLLLSFYCCLRFRIVSSSRLLSSPSSFNALHRKTAPRNELVAVGIIKIAPLSGTPDTHLLFTRDQSVQIAKLSFRRRDILFLMFCLNTMDPL
jgi:hypothetical protein